MVICRDKDHDVNALQQWYMWWLSNPNIFIQIRAAKVAYNKGVVYAEPHNLLDLCNLRFAVDSALGKINGVHWVITSIGGERHRRSGEDSFHIAALVGYTETDSNKGDFVNAVMHDTGLNVTVGDHRRNDDKLVKCIEYMFKDHKNECVQAKIDASNQNCMELASLNRGTEGSSTSLDVSTLTDDSAICSTSVR